MIPTLDNLPPLTELWAPRGQGLCPELGSQMAHAGTRNVCQQGLSGAVSSVTCDSATEARALPFLPHPPGPLSLAVALAAPRAALVAGGGLSPPGWLGLSSARVISTAGCPHAQTHSQWKKRSWPPTSQVQRPPPPNPSLHFLVPLLATRILIGWQN